MRSVLMVVSAARYWTLRDGTRHPTGVWAEELAEPHRLFTEAGWRVTIATPGGAAPVVDRLSLRPPAATPWKIKAYRRYLAGIADQLQHPRPLADVSLADYDAVFYPGGHGPMEDLAVDSDSGALLTEALGSGKPLALLCHAPAAMLAAKDADGGWPFAGYTMTGLSNREERLNRFARQAAWLLQDRLVEQGARYVTGRIPLLPFITVDRNLYTGQNPASSAKLAKRLIADLTDTPALAVSVDRVIPASADALYALVSDVTSIGRRSPETYAATWIEPGRRFKGRNRIGSFYRWSTVATITEATPGRAFAFSTAWPSSSTWRYDLQEVDGGTRVTESMTRATPQMSPVLWLQRMSGVPDRTAHLRAGMSTTLERLAAEATLSARPPATGVPTPQRQS